MAYECQTFKKGQILTHECMNKIDEWLAYICGREIVSGEVNADGELVFTTCDGSTLSVGKIASSGGSNGNDGFSPTVEIIAIEGGTRIIITDVNGPQSVDIMDGNDGEDGTDGKDGTSVTVKSVSESTADGGSNVITFSDGKTVTVKNGSAGKDGEDGQDGSNGVSATHSWNGTTLTVTSASGTSSANLKGDKGDKGDPGEKGETGETGAAGKDGANGKDGVDGKTPVKGTDYWTDADKAEIKSYVDDAILGGAW